jgi:RimJ/RimL family protein N-acetyltransferase
MDVPALEPVLLTLRDGRRVTVRAVRADDREALQTAVRGLSMEARHSRFFSPLRELPPSLLERATHPDPENERQLVAVGADGDEERIVGGARYAATATPGNCEFAVAIADDWTGHGLARRLLELLMDDARTRGFRRMEGFVLTTNTGMLALARRLGFVESASSEGPTVRLVRRDLAGAG